MRRADANEAGGKLVEIRFSDADRAGIEEKLHDRRIRFRHVGKSGQAAVVGSPATSMLSFTAKGIP